MTDTAASSEGDLREKRLRTVGYGIVVSGLLTLAVAVGSTRPRGILVVGLGALALVMFVVEQLEGTARGASVGLLTGSFGAWLWPNVDGGSYLVLGGILVVVGLLNAATTPYFYRFGERLAER